MIGDFLNWIGSLNPWLPICFVAVVAVWSGVIFPPHNGPHNS